MTMATIVLSALLLWQGADDQKAGDLIRDLGADEFAVRERAERELRKMGDAALPALREALEDKDPERALRAHRVLRDLEKKEGRSEQDRRSRAWTAYRDFGRGIIFETHPDGKVELTVREPNADGGRKETRTYRADSLEEFKKKYPELASKYDLDNLAPKEKWTFWEDPEDVWESWRKRFEQDWFGRKFALPWFPFRSDPWVLPHRKPEPPVQGDSGKEDSGRPQLGISIEKVGSALAEQLGLGADEGLVIVEVKTSSPAQRAGLRRHDILLKVNGKALTGPEALRRDVEAGLQNGMELEILRRGKRETVKVEPSPANSK